MLVVSGDSFNRSRIRTVTVAVITSNIRLAQAPGNVLLEAQEAGLDRDSVVNVSALFTLDEQDVEQPAGHLVTMRLRAVDRGLRLALGL